MTQHFTGMRNGEQRAVAVKKAAFERQQAANQPQPEDPRIEQAQRTLGLMLADYREKQPDINRQTAREMQHMVRDFRETCKRRGIDMPKLTVVYFVRMNHVCVWPAELELAEIQKRMRMFIVHRQRHGRDVIAEDLAIGVRRAYPDYSPSRTTLILPPTVKPLQETTHAHESV